MSKNFTEILSKLKQIFNCTTDGEIAKLLNIEHGTFSYMKKKGNVPAMNIIELSRKHKFDIEYVFFGEKAKNNEVEKIVSKNDSIELSIYDDVNASAGYGCLNGDHCCATHLFVDKNLFPRTTSKKIDAIKVNGDSMDPTFTDGDIIFVDKFQHEIKNGKIYIIRMSGEVFVKRIFISPKGIIIKSDNEHYPSFEITQTDIEIIGKVIYSLKHHG